MNETKAVAIVGVGAILPDAPDPQTFWRNIQAGLYSIREVPPDRWRTDFYYNPDPVVPDKTYSKIGGWVQGFKLEPFKMGIAIPPKVLSVMDEAQQWAIAASYQALVDYGYPKRQLDSERAAVILGNAMAGEYHYRTSLRIYLPEYLDVLEAVPAFQGLTDENRKALIEGMGAGIRAKIPSITEDTMPGELSNIIAGRVANAFNFGGTNYVTDAACASSLAALQNAIDGLNNYQFDAVLTGGVDRNMGPESFVKFSKVGALSPDGSRPYADGANGFVMGEGTVIFLIKRLADAERDGDNIYAVIRGIGGSSDGKGKGITAPNPIGQQRAIERAWKNAELSPASAGLIEGHGTSTKVGDVVEVGSLNSVFGSLGLPVGKIALGSVKSNIGHLKSAAGAAALLKIIYALHDQILPPSVNFERPNPQIDFAHIPFQVNTATSSWEIARDQVRRAGISSFGFGGTNFHLVVDEYVPGLLTSANRGYPGVELKTDALVESQSIVSTGTEVQASPFYRDLLFLSAETPAELKQTLLDVIGQARDGVLPISKQPTPQALSKPERLTFDYSSIDELLTRAEKSLKAFDTESANSWQPLTNQGVYRGSGKPGKIAFLFPGQGSQYVNMLRDLSTFESVIAETYREADQVMTPILGKPLTDYIFVNGDEATLTKTEAALKNTEITQPAVLTANVALLRLMNKFGFTPDLVIGHSLGEYAALVAAGVFTFPEALEIVSARGREMAKVSAADNGCMAAITAPLEDVERILKGVEGYVVIANINSPMQSVIGGATAAIDAAILAFQAANFQAVKIPVSHAFHTKIVAPASGPLRQVIARMDMQPARMPVVANVTGQLYPTEREAILDILAQQVASPVQFVEGMKTLYANGARIFVEVGPKRVLNTLAADNLKEYSDVTILATNHPRKDARICLNEALAGLLAAGVTSQTMRLEQVQFVAPILVGTQDANIQAAPSVYSDGRLPLTGSVVISGVGLGLPGRDAHVFSDDNVQRIMSGEVLIESLPQEARNEMLEKRVTRLIKSEAGAVIETISDLSQTIKLAGQRGSFDPEEEFGIPADRLEATDISTQLAIAAGVEALRDAGIPLVMAYRQTSKGTYLPNRWQLPEALVDETGVIFASAFPGLDQMAEEADRFYEHQALTRQMDELRQVLVQIPTNESDLQASITNRIAALDAQLAQLDYHFDRRFIFRVMAMGHSQFAEYIGARGPNTHVNAACATTTHAIALAEDWIRLGRCRRVVVIAGDDITSGHLLSWVGTGMLATGAATTEGNPRMAALPFDRRRNGMLMGMGAAALVVEAEDAAKERGVRAICEVLATQIANSAFHGTRLDVQHVCEVMEQLVSQAEQRFNIRRADIAPRTVFVSHETYTPARGGSAAAEINALRHTFGDLANQVVIANTKGFTGHTMGVGVEDIIAVKSLEHGTVPPIANIDNGFEPDPDLGDLRLSHGGQYPIQYALRLGAGFGSQLAMTLMQKIPGTGERTNREIYNQWLAKVAGYNSAEVEVIQRTLRIHHDGPPVHQPAHTNWRFGQGPSAWAITAPHQALVEAKEPQTAPATVQERGETTTPKSQSEAGQSLMTLSADKTDEIKAYILGQVSEKTGYPIEMLDLELDLEADLGIDTVKQAELFASMREHYGIPRRENLRLADYNTLTKVIGFVSEAIQSDISGVVSQPEVKSAAVQPVPLVVEAIVEQQPAGGTSPAKTEEIKGIVLGLVSEKTGYPVEMLDLELDLEADLGIDTVKQAELFASVREQYNIPRREDLRLADYNTLTKVIGFVSQAIQSDISGVVSQPEVKSAAAQPVPVVVEAKVEQQPAVDTSSSKTEEIKGIVLGLVSEKTGYPIEMLDLDLDLEADLGIDTVKQAELFASVREQYNIPRREDLRLADYNTLTKVIGFVLEAIQASTSEPTGTVEQPAPTGPSAEKTETIQSVEPAQVPAASVKVDQVIIRRVPMPVLRPRIDLCLETGVTLEAISKVLVVKDRGKASTALVRRLRDRKVDVLILDASALEDVNDKITAFLAGGSLDGIYFLPALDVEPSLKEMSLEDWKTGLDRRVYSLYAILQSLPGGNPFLVCATRLGGMHGYGLQGATAPFGGAVSGFAKALARERTEIFVKVVDFETDAKPAAIASCLIEETLYDPGAVEIGRQGDLRFSVALVEENLPVEVNGELREGSVFLVSGGTGGIVNPVLVDLARAMRSTFYLLGRTVLPDCSDPDLKRLITDRDGLKKEIMERLAKAGNKPTPVQVEAKLAALDRANATFDTIELLGELGSEVHYLPCDVTDFQAVQQAVQVVLKSEGHLDVLIHAAGIEHSRKLESKPFEEFRQVVVVKADGFFHLFKALQEQNKLPSRVVIFSSVAGRFGNSGQTDYSAANDLLCKLISAMRVQYPEIKGIILDWGAWSEVGMASRGNIPALMRLAGIEMLQPQEAASMVKAELLAGSGGEVVLAGSLGMLTAGRKPDGGMNIHQANLALTEGKPIHKMLSRLTGMDLDEGIILETELDPQVEPFLMDHTLDGTPILPGVVGIEGFSIAARHIASVLVSKKRKFTVSHMEDIQFLVPFKFYYGKPRRITWKAQVVYEAGNLVAKVTLESTVARPSKTHERIMHFSGRVYLQPQETLEIESVTNPPEWIGGYTVQAEDIYRLYFHGPTFQVLEGVQRSGDCILGKLRANRLPFTMFDQSPSSVPILVELCLQTAGIWEIGKTGIMALPQSIQSLTLHSQKINGVAIFAEVVPVAGEDGRMAFNARVVDADGHLYLELNNYRTSPLPYSVEQDLLRPLQALVDE